MGRRRMAAFQSLSSHRAGQHWEVWTDWYDARLAGDAARPPIEALEVARLKIADEIWRQGPAAVNAEIQRLIDGHKGLDRPVADLRIGSRESLKIWMRGQSREVAVAIAARAALRLLPLLVRGAPNPASARLTRRFATLVCVAFQAAALARMVCKYPSRGNKFRASAARFPSTSEIYQFENSGAEALLLIAATSAANSAAEAAFATTKATAVSAAVDAGTTASKWAATVQEDDLLATVVAPNWRAITADAAQLKVIAPSALMDAPLWPEETPGWASDAIATMRSTLPRDQDWDLWFDWLEERLRGGTRGEAYEVVFATTPELWEEDAPEVNAWIREHLPKHASLPGPLENIPSAFTYAWNASGKIAVVAGLQNTPVFPFATSEAEHRDLLEAVRRAAQRLILDLRARKFDNVRPDFFDELRRYAGDLPTAPAVGNFVLADMEALNLRALFEAEADILASPFATRLKTLLQFHIALRAYYPEVERVYAAVGKGRLERPLPMDAVAAISKLVAENTPRFFEPEVTGGLEAVERAQPIIESGSEDRRAAAAPVLPPPDPLGAPELKKSRSFTIGSAINSLTRVALAGGSAGAAAEGWAKVAHQLQETAGPVINWLRGFLGP